MCNSAISYKTNSPLPTGICDFLRSLRAIITYFKAPTTMKELSLTLHYQANTQLSNFFLEQEYTDYFRVQEVIGNLVDANLILAESTHSNTQYMLTSAGKETLNFFSDKLTEAIIQDVMRFFTNNKMVLRQENSIFADYYKTTSQGYAVRCQIRSDNKQLVDLTITVKTKEQAEAICNNWK